jgi:hypothetical protein
VAAIDDVFAGTSSSIAASGIVDIKPASGQEVTLQYIAHEFPIEVYFYNGTTLVEFDSGAVSIIRGEGIPLTSEEYIRVKNTHTAAQYISWRGRYTKV